MARLNRAETIDILRLFVRSQNRLKGKALDQARAAFPPDDPEDRRFMQFKKDMKDTESGVRKVFLETLVAAGLVEAVDHKELFEMK